MNDLKRLGVEAPSGDLARDLKDGKRVLLRRGQPCVEVRAAKDLGDRVLTFVCSTDGIKRDGNRVRNEANAWDFGNFSKNPVMLWTHDYGSPDRPPLPPIGSWVDWRVERTDSGSALVMSGKFANHDFADMIYNLYLDGHMRAVSIGWTPLEYQEIVEDGRFVGWDFTRNELLECSAVPIPADPDAIMIAAQRGLISEGNMDHFRNWTTTSRGVAYVLDSRPAPTRSWAEDLWREVGVAAEAASAADAVERAPGDAPMEEPAGGEATDPADEQVNLALASCERVKTVLADIATGVDAVAGMLSADVADDAAEAETPSPEASDDQTSAALAAVDTIATLASQVIAECETIRSAFVVDAEDDASEGEGQPLQQPMEVMEAASRVGKKISGSRYQALCDAHDAINRGCKTIRQILDEAESERVPAEAAALKKRLEEATRRKEILELTRRLESVNERRARLATYAEILLPTAGKKR